MEDDKVSKKAKEIISRFESLKTDRAQFEEVWRECEFAISPISQNWQDEKPKDKYKIPPRETSQPTSYMNTCCTGIAGYAASANIKWFQLSLMSDELNEADGVPQWLSKCERIMRRTFERCGLYKRLTHWIELSCIYGHSAMLIEEVSNADAPIRYHVPEAQEVYFDNNDIGETEVVYRYYWSDVENIVNRYGKKAMHKKIVEQYDKWLEQKEDGKNTTPLDMKILHAVQLRRNGKPEYGETVANKKWASYIVDVENKHIIKESGYDDFPYALFFWQHTGKPYGISPTIMGLNDIKMYQQAYNGLLRCMQKIADPTYTVPMSGKRQWNFAPGAINEVTSMEQAPQPTSAGAEFAQFITVMSSLESHVKDWYNVDFFIMLRQQQGLANMTATAIGALQGEQVALLAALVSNLFEGLNKIVQRTFDILAKKKLLPPLPFALQQMGGSLKVDFVGVLAQAQKMAYEYSNIQAALGIAGQYNEFGKVDPRFSRVINWIKEDKLFKMTLDSLGISPEVLRTEEEYNKLMAGIDEKEAAQAAQQAAAQENQALLQNFKNLGKKPEQGSPAENWLSPLGLQNR
ncbi:MAG: hypothetical protein Ta2B_09290 [Termitinemataceae bacterium]|nr:MAG: hypothetical protein Ta2B_09290 [Termitinemataceae bacterium]